MELDQAIRTRRSERHFSDEPVPREVVEALIAEASWAPSAGNRQPWRVAALEPGAARPLVDALEPKAWEILYPTLREVIARDPGVLGQQLSGRELTDATLSFVAREIYLKGAPWLLVIHFPRPSALERGKVIATTAALLPHRVATRRSVREKIELALFMAQHANVAMRTDFLADVGSVAGFMYGLTLAAAARGVASCVQYSWALVADEVRATLGLPAG
ncbi:MAG: hypothetical protein CVT68_11945, partial [Actinobacteria bacterium HGW-Actinobacteria-8]